MLRTVWGLALIGLVVFAAGCGGGGGAASIGSNQAASLLPLEMTGDYTVRNLGLPDDQMSVEADGQVVVASSATRGTVAIGTCSTDGTLNLHGNWQAGGDDYSITGSGSISPSSGAVLVRATVLTGSTPVYEDAQVSGIKETADGLDAPPPPPIFDDSGEEIDNPPAPPLTNDDATVGAEDGIDMPPPPPMD